MWIEPKYCPDCDEPESLCQCGEPTAQESKEGQKMTFEQWLDEPIKDSKYGHTRRDCYTEAEIKLMAVAWYAALETGSNL